MVNKTLLPPWPAPAKHLILPKPKFSQLARLSLIGWRTAAWESLVVRTIRRTGLGGLWRAAHRRGEPAMENTLLVGLSRQMTLERQMDVVANNVANVNTTGFKADRSMFEEYPHLAARMKTISPRRTAASATCRTARTFKDFAQGASEQTKNPLDVAIDGGGFLVVQTPAGERYTRDGGLKINNQGQLVTAAGYPVLGDSGPIVFQPTDKRDHHRRRRQRHRGRRHQPDRLGARQAAAGQLRRRRKAGEGRLQPLLGRRRRRRRSPTSSRRCSRASSRNRTSIR